MKNSFNKKLLSLLLTLVMTISTVPTALAACSHSNWSSWTKLNDAQHQRTCLTSGCTEVEKTNHGWGSTYEKDTSSHWQKCATCGAQTAHSAHTYGSAMTSDATNHWDQCTVCGYKDHLGGHVDLNLDAKCDTCARSIALTYVTVTFMNGTATYKAKANVAKGGTPADPGTPTKAAENGVTYTFKGWTTRNPGPSALYDRQSYLSSAQVASTALTQDTVYYALFEADETAVITYEVAPGEGITFNRSDFRDIFEDAYSDTFRSVIFTADRSLKDSSGVMYYDYDGKDEEEFSRNDLHDWEFYYRSDDYGDFPINDLAFIADAKADGKVVTLSMTLYGDTYSMSGTLNIHIGTVESDDDTDILYQVDTDKAIQFNRDDFKTYFDDKADDDTFRYVTFYPDSSLKESRGVFYYDYDGKDEEEFTRENLSVFDFYHKSASYGDYPLSDLVFVPDDDANGKIVTLEFVVWGDEEDYTGTLKILIGDATEADAELGDIQYTVAPEAEVEFDRADFNRFFREEYSKTVRYVTFYPDKTLKSSNGTLYSRYDTRSEVEFDREDLELYKFYYSDETYGDYDLDDLSFVADEDIDEVVTLEFRAWYDEETYVDGLLTISPTTLAENTTATSSIRLSTTTGTALQINANEIARFFKKAYPTGTFQSVKLTGVPKTGTLYYDYYSKDKTKLTASSCDDNLLYLDPGRNQYTLSALTYIPDGTNYCVTIPFTATGKSTSQSVEGALLINVTKAAVSEVYGVTTKNAVISLNGSTISAVVYNATGISPSAIQLLELPDASEGTVSAALAAVSMAADTETKYHYGSDARQFTTFRFTPASGFTGSVEIPYLAYDKNDTPIACGKLCVGVVNSVKRFSDITSSTWCYKYVTELSDANVIGGYTDGTFKPNDSITYGAALKLVTLAAGHGEKAPTGTHTFSGYLTYAQQKGWISGTVNLSGTITRLQIAQLAAKAMGLDVTNLPSTKPFTDTADVYVQALNAAGIIEGYFANGTYTYKPSNTLTRGQVSAIVWRMRNY